MSAAIFDTLEEVVVAATYDKEGDMAYVITYNTNGSSFILQQFEPQSRKFTKLGVTAPSTWLELGWNPADKSLYLFDESAALNKYDSKGKRFTQVNTMGMEIEGYTQSMVYSPKDNAFILPVDLYDETEDKEYTGMFLLPVAVLTLILAICLTRRNTEYSIRQMNISTLMDRRLLCSRAGT